MRDSDAMKLKRDGWLGYGPKPKHDGMIRPIFAFVRKLPNGNILTTDGGRGHIEWGPRPKDGES